MSRKIHIFDNGIRVYDDHLIPPQRKRYAQNNVHEVEEEEIFLRIPVDGCFVNIGSAIGYYLHIPAQSEHPFRFNMNTDSGRT